MRNVERLSRAFFSAWAALCLSSAACHKPSAAEIAEQRLAAEIEELRGDWVSYDGKSALFLGDNARATYRLHVNKDTWDHSLGSWSLKEDRVVIATSGQAGSHSFTLKHKNLDGASVLVPDDDAPISQCFFDTRYVDPAQSESDPPESD